MLEKCSKAEPTGFEEEWAQWGEGLVQLAGSHIAGKREPTRGVERLALLEGSLNSLGQKEATPWRNVTQGRAHPLLDSQSLGDRSGHPPPTGPVPC